MLRVSYKSVVPAKMSCKIFLDLPQARRDKAGPVSYYPEQDLASLYKHIPRYETEIPSCLLRIGVVEDATILVHPGYDGVLIDRYGRALLETCYYSNIIRTSARSGVIEVDALETELDSLFTSFDSTWFIYYHWLCFAIGPAAMMRTLHPTVPIGIPSYDDQNRLHPVSYSRDVYEQSLEMLGLQGRILKLRPGVYRVKKAYVPFVENGQNTDITAHPYFIRSLRQVAEQVAGRTKSRRIFVSRRLQGANARLSSDEDAMFERVAAQYGFEQVLLEQLTFADQVRLFGESEAVIAPHGGGLANVLFSPPGLKLVELSSELDGNGSLRPWFYVIAEGAGHHYALLNRNNGDFVADRLAACLEALGLGS